MAKGRKGKKSKVAKGLNILNEVDKTFYELQITDLHRKLARLKSLTTELEEKKLEQEANYSKLESDRGDVIIYLKRISAEKQTEISELHEKLTTVEEAKVSEAQRYIAKIQQQEEDYKQMREQLTSEVKLVSGKLNALEEFRIQRDDLMRRFEEQEKFIEENEMRQKRMLYEIEKKFILSKDAIKKEMEKQLFELGAEFQRKNNLRIAATTQRAIRENITINNELNILSTSNDQLEMENYDLKISRAFLKQNCELFTKERNKALSDSSTQRGVIDQLTKEHKKLTETLSHNLIVIEIGKQNERKLSDSLQREGILSHKIKILEQNLHASRCQKIALQTEINNRDLYLAKFRGVMCEAIAVIKSAMMIQTQPDLDEGLKKFKREDLLNHLCILLSQTKDEIIPAVSLDSIQSVTALYAKGDLGFIPKVHTEKRPPPLKFNVDSQVGRSFEDLLESQRESIQESSSISEEEEEEEEEVEVEEEEPETLRDSAESLDTLPVQSEASDTLTGTTKTQIELHSTFMFGEYEITGEYEEEFEYEEEEEAIYV